MVCGLWFCELWFEALDGISVDIRSLQHSFDVRYKPVSTFEDSQNQSQPSQQDAMKALNQLKNVSTQARSNLAKTLSEFDDEASKSNEIEESKTFNLDDKF